MNVLDRTESGSNSDCNTYIAFFIEQGELQTQTLMLKWQTVRPTTASCELPML